MTTPAHQTSARPAGGPSDGVGPFFEVLLVFTRLGLTSFGGPVAHLGYFRQEVVARRRWVDEEAYADLVALCQFLPGPASSQVGIGLGTARAGLAGGLAAWLGFTLPSAVLMVLFAYGVATLAGPGSEGWLHGLKVAAVAVVALAVWGMARTLCPDRPRMTLAVLAAAITLAWQGVLGQLLVIALGGGLGWWLLRGAPATPPPAHTFAAGRTLGIAALALLAALLLGLPLLRGVVEAPPLALADSFLRVGSLVFGGGHVVLPLLQAEVVPAGWATTDQFIAGYGAAQAVPGPLFTFAAYLGAISGVGPGPWAGAALALGAIFLPSFLLVWGVLPFWDSVRRMGGVRRALGGVNAAVVGLLLAALYDPVWTSAIHTPLDFALALAAFTLLAFWRWPPWLVVALTALGGAVLAWL